MDYFTIYTENDNEELFEQETCMAIMDSCGFNKAQAERIYNEAYGEAHSFGLSSIVSIARVYSEMIREVINLEDVK